MRSNRTIGFLGTGKMATALASAWRNAHLLDATSSLSSDPSQASQTEYRETTGLPVVSSNVEVAQACDVLVIAVKPGIVGDVLKEVHSVIQPRHLIISIAAGVTIREIASLLPAGIPIVRVMPNTPCLVGAGAIAFTGSEVVSQNDMQFVESLLSAVGLAFSVPENLLNAVTGLSGSGPAYVFLMIEALADGGVRSGLPRHIAQSLAAQTVFGSAKMILDTHRHPAELKDAVSSPGGTTIRGLQMLEQYAVRAALIDAVVAATERAQELGAK